LWFYGSFFEGIRVALQVVGLLCLPKEDFMNERMKVLIAHDGSTNANAILDDLWIAGLPRSVDATVITVAEMWLPAPAGFAKIEENVVEGFPFDMAKIHSMTSHVCDSIKSDFPDWTVRPEIYIGSPAREILAKAERWKPDLIVLGSRGQSALSRFIFGSVAQKVASETKASVRISRVKPKTCCYSLKMIIGVDGSDGANAAVEAVASRSWPTGSQVRLFTAVDSLPMVEAGLRLATLPSGVKILEKTKSVLSYVRYVQKTLKENLEPRLRSAGLSVSYVVREGDPRQTLLDEAERWEADCILVGSRGFGHFKRILLGSVSTAIVARAHCSVEVVRNGKD
jgi:nucleotide-binding universal stress UspA family protein